MKIASLIGSSSLSLPKSSYIYSLQPVSEGIAAISSDDSLRIFDRETLQLISNGVLVGAHEGVTCLRNGGNENHLVWTAGRDSTLKGWDMRTGKKTLELGDRRDAPYLSLAVDPNTSRIAAGTEFCHSQAAVLLWDYRAEKEPILEYVDSHNDDITELAFHPTITSHLLSGSTDGLVNIYNTNVQDEDDALIEVMNHGASISHAGFVSEKLVYALSHDEVFSIYHIDYINNRAEDIPPIVFGNLRPIVSCEYIIDVIPLDGSVIVGAGTHSKHQVDLVPLHPASQWTPDWNETVRLKNAHGEDIVRSVYLDHLSNTLLTAGEDGSIKSWKLERSDLVSRIGPDRNRGKKEITLNNRLYKPY